MEKAKFYQVKSFTKKGVVYTVRKLPTGEWLCSCPNFLFRNSKCNHIRQVQHLKLKRT